MELKEARKPTHLKVGFYGGTGTGKSFTATKVMSQFMATYRRDSRVVMFDTEPSAGYVAPMVKKITGKDLLIFNSRSFSDLLEFTQLCIQNKYIAIVDSVTHPWRSLCNDYLDAKRARVKGAGGNPETVKLSLKDWGPLKDMWGRFTELYVYSPIDMAILGREGDVWEEVKTEEGESEMRKTGTKMKTETELGYEPSLLVQMRLEDNGHYAFVVKDRFDLLTGALSANNPDMDFFLPHITSLDLGGVPVQPNVGRPAFNPGTGPAWETIKARRDAILENIKDDLVLAIPGQTADEKKHKIALLRSVFKTSSWTELESDEKKFPQDVLEAGRKQLQKKLQAIIKENADAEKN